MTVQFSPASGKNVKQILILIYYIWSLSPSYKAKVYDQ